MNYLRIKENGNENGKMCWDIRLLFFCFICLLFLIFVFGGLALLLVGVLYLGMGNVSS
jgi:hypothetical protein